MPLPLPRVMGVFERLTGSPAWRHYEQFAGGLYEGRAEVELVVRSIAQVGNYDYLLDWIFTQHGGMRVEVGLTGINAVKAVGPRNGQRGGDGPRFSTLVAPELEAPFHSHHFNFRLDLDVDGQNNTFLLGKLKQRPAPGPRKSIWTLTERAIESESEGRLDHDESQWKDADERFAAGDTPNQHPGAPGLSQYIRDNQGLIDRDIVLWLTVGFHHVTQAEDWPVLSREHLSFELKPSNFFDRNPALDLRRAPFKRR